MDSSLFQTSSWADLERLTMQESFAIYILFPQRSGQELMARKEMFCRMTTHGHASESHLHFRAIEGEDGEHRCSIDYSPPPTPTGVVVAVPGVDHAASPFQRARRKSIKA